MAEIRNYAFAKHLRAEPNAHIIQYNKGRLRRSGRGLSFWFLGMATSLAEIPLDDQEMNFLFHGRSLDFQDVTAQGVISYRVVEPELAANRIDFSVNQTSGAHRKQPLQVLSELHSELAQQFASAYVSGNKVREILSNGLARIRVDIRQGFADELSLRELGVEVVSVRISSIRPSSDLEKALETKAREEIQQTADEAMFERRALAVEKERAIAENELANQIELASREEALIAQEGKNQRNRAIESAGADRISAEGAAERRQIENKAKSEGISMMEAAKVAAERERIEIYRDLPTSVMMGLATKELATKLRKIEHLNISPDMIGPSLLNLMNLGSKRLEGGAK